MLLLLLQLYSLVSYALTSSSPLPPPSLQLLDETTQEALTELRLAAEARGANGVVNVRLSTTTTMNRMIVGLHATVVVYGTAVRVRPLQ